MEDTTKKEQQPQPSGLYGGQRKTPIPEGVTAFTWADRESLLKREVTIRRSKWTDEVDKALTEECPQWLLWLSTRRKKTTRSMLLFARVVLRLYGIERMELEKPGLGGISVISKRGKVVREISYEWPRDEEILGKPQTVNSGGFELQGDGGQAQLDSQ